MHLTTASLPVFSILVSTGLTAPQFGFNLGNFFGGFLGNRGNRGQPTGQTAPAFGSSQSSGTKSSGSIFGKLRVIPQLLLTLVKFINLKEDPESPN